VLFRSLVPPPELEALFLKHGLRLRRSKVVPLKLGKSFWAGSFGR
jgi:hypothetical protein